MLWPWKHPEPAQHWPAQQMQPGERKLHFVLHAHHPKHPATAGPLGQVLQQRRLAHARLAMEYQGTALPGPDSLNQAIQPSALSSPVYQRPPAPMRAATYGAWRGTVTEVIDRRGGGTSPSAPVEP